MNDLKEMLFLNQKFNILSLKCNPASHCNVTDAYAFAWYSGVYPFFDDGAEWHKPYSAFFEVTEEMMDDLSMLLDKKWTEKQSVSFYELEKMLGVNGSVYPGPIWDRSSLIKACRYMFLDGVFDEEFWATLCENMKSPSEARSIVRPFDVNQVYFL